MLHIGKNKKCKQPCPKLSIHDGVMKEDTSAKYLGDVISCHGGVKDTLENRRNKGWGKIAEIMGILSELPNIYTIEVGLQLRETKLCNGVLYSAEAWSSITDSELDRIEQLDTSLLKTIIDGHAKCNKAFYYLEFGLLSFRHLIMIKPLMYHHIITRDNNETIKEIYMKQKESNTKGDWFRMLMKDFEFIGVEMDEEAIKNTSKEVYYKDIKKKVKVGAFKYFIQIKEKSKKKMQHISYTNITLQDYMHMQKFSLKEKKLLFSLRSSCYPARMNFKKMNRLSLTCSLKCNTEETQFHIFQSCRPILEKLGVSEVPQLSQIYGSHQEQKPCN